MNGKAVVLALLSILLLAPLYAPSAYGQGAGLGQAQDPFSSARPEADKVVQSSEKLLEKLQKEVNSQVSADVLRQAAAVAIFPHITPTSENDGMSHGSGVLIARRSEGWSLPVFVNFAGERVAPESRVDTPEGLMLVFNHTETIRQLAEGFDFILGSDATLAAGGLQSAPQTTAQIVAFAPQAARWNERSIQGAAITLESEYLGEYYRLNQDAVREYFGEEEQLIRQFLGLDQEINSNAQGIENVPESARALQQRLKNYTALSE